MSSASVFLDAFAGTSKDVLELMFVGAVPVAIRFDYHACATFAGTHGMMTPGTCR